ncbi:MAG: type IV pilus modification PilV family protein [Patescibacteria group bacterium]
MNFLNKSVSGKSGWSLLEVLIGVTLASVVIMVLIGGLTRANQAGQLALNRSVASFYTEEAAEALFYLANDWSDNFQDLTFGLAYDVFWSAEDNTWVLAEAETESVFGFDRQIIFSQVERDANGRLTTDGSIDPDTLKVVIEVRWQDRSGEQFEELEAYLFNNYFGASD